MSNYIDISRLLKRDFVTQLYELPRDEQMLNDDIASAEITVNASVGKRYSVPVTAADQVAHLRTLAEALFAELAYTLHAAGSEIPEKIKAAADVARKQLDSIASGDLTVGGELPAEQSGGTSGIMFDCDDPEYTKEKLAGF